MECARPCHSPSTRCHSPHSPYSPTQSLHSVHSQPANSLNEDVAPSALSHRLMLRVTDYRKARHSQEKTRSNRKLPGTKKTAEEVTLRNPSRRFSHEYHKKLNVVPEVKLGCMDERGLGGLGFVNRLVSGGSPLNHDSIRGLTAFGRFHNIVRGGGAQACLRGAAHSAQGALCFLSLSTVWVFLPCKIRC